MSNESASGNIPTGFKLRHILRGHKHHINGLAWSPDGQMLASCSGDHTIRLWNAEAGILNQILQRHNLPVTCMAWSPDGRILATGGLDNLVYFWNTETWALSLTLKGYGDFISALAWSPGGETLAAASGNGVIRLWDIKAAKPRLALELGTRGFCSVAWSPDGQLLASGSRSGILLWDPETGDLLWDLTGSHEVSHSIIDAAVRAPVPFENFGQAFAGAFEKTSGVMTLVWSPDGQTLASGSSDKTIRIWDPKGARETYVLEGHTDAVISLSFSPDSRLLVSKSWDNTVRFWRCDTYEPIAVFPEPSIRGNPFMSLVFHPTASILATLGQKNTDIRVWDLDFVSLLDMPPTTQSVHYINAKVVLLGESGVGKSGLGIRIAESRFRPTESTHGAQFWQIPIPNDVVQQIGDLPAQAELTLWDLAGQPEYHLVHQLFLDDIDTALLLFDCSDPADPFRGVSYWAKVLKKHAPPHALKYLVSSRCDVSPVVVDQKEIGHYLIRYGLDAHFCTSAKTGEGINALMHQVLKGIQWDKLPRTSTPLLFKAIREYLLERKEAGRALISLDEVQHAVQESYTKREVTRAEIDTVVSLLQARGLVYRLEPARDLAVVLLKPELLNQYASSIIQAARRHSQGIGAIAEREAVAADLPFAGYERLGPQDEKILLESTVELLIRHDLCFREMGLLVFPSQINVTRPAPAEEHPPSEVTYEFSGSIETIYASLVVRLSYTDYFQREDQWKYAVEFSRQSHRLGFSMQQVEEGTGELEIYFYPGVTEFDRVTFIRFITDHLRTKGVDIRERIRLYCHQCNKEVENRDAIEARVKAGKLDIPCQYCGASVIIPRSIEERYRSDMSYVKKQQELTEKVHKRTAKEVWEFQADRRQYTQEQDNAIHILQLSDIHLSASSEARQYRAQLETDLLRELKISRLEYLVISGDIGNHSTSDEYRASFELIDGLVKRFGLDSSRVVVVPGNHDLNWDLAEEAYPFIPKRKLPDNLREGRYIPAGEAGALVRSEELYRQRFANFSLHFYKKVYSGREYPLNYAEQGILHLCPDDRLLFLALNSAWEIDQHYQNRASINMEALSRALDQLQDSKYNDWLKISLWHHPVTGREMMRDEFLELLAVHDFQICMHGHIHEAIEGYHKYDRKRGLHIVGAGTFGAPLRKQAGIPLQYNLLTLDPETRTIRVNTRKKEKPDGAWSADARWGDKNDPKPWYMIELS